MPEFFSDPFFLKEADPAVVEALRAPERQARVRENPTTEVYRQALRTAQKNLTALAGEGVVPGDDPGPIDVLLDLLDASFVSSGPKRWRWLRIAG